MVETSTPPPPASPRHTRGPRATRDARIHVVVEGESLWSIARDHLGRSASNAAIARAVHRLWELNKTVIATGNPDLLPVGAKLNLR